MIFKMGGDALPAMQERESLSPLEGQHFVVPLVVGKQIVLF